MSGLSSPGEGILSSGTPGFSWWTSARLRHLVRSNVRHVPDFLSSWAPSWGHVPRCRECLGQAWVNQRALVVLPVSGNPEAVLRTGYLSCGDVFLCSSPHSAPTSFTFWIYFFLA